MGFMGGLAGTLGKILETQDAEQRREASQMRAEDRADMRAFNKEDNIYEENGEMFSSITLSDGKVLKKKLSPDAVAAYKGKGLKQKAENIESNNIIEEQDSISARIANDPKYAGKTVQQVKQMEEDARELTMADAKAGILDKYDAKSERRKLGTALATAGAKVSGSSNKNQLLKTLNSMADGVLKGTYAQLPTAKLDKFREIVTAAAAGHGGAMLQFSEWVTKGYIQKVQSGDEDEDASVATGIPNVNTVNEEG